MTRYFLCVYNSKQGLQIVGRRGSLGRLMKTTQKRDVIGTRAARGRSDCRALRLGGGTRRGAARAVVRRPSPRAARSRPAASAVAAHSGRCHREGAGRCRHPSSPTTPRRFSRRFFRAQLGHPWNVFGAQNGNREVKGGSEGLWIKIADAEKAWDAVGARTVRSKSTATSICAGAFAIFRPGQWLRRSSSWSTPSRPRGGRLRRAHSDRRQEPLQVRRRGRR